MSIPAVDPAAPAIERQEGPSFSPLMKTLASALVGGLLLAAAAAAFSGATILPWHGGGWFVGVVALVVVTGYWGILTSRTGIDGEYVWQTWLWRKQVRLAEVTQLKLIMVPGLSWLVAPRLVVRCGMLNITTFHTADAHVLAAFRRLAYGA